MGKFALLLLSACGRVGFDGPDPDRRPDGSDPAIDANASDGATAFDGTTSAQITWVKTFVARYPGGGTTDSFAAAASNTGNAIVMYIGCAETNGAPTGATVTAPGWTFAPRAGGIVTNNRISGITFFAIAPNTMPATFVVTWSGANCNAGSTEIADEFTNNDPAATFDGEVLSMGIGHCATTLTQLHDNDAIWASCHPTSYTLTVGPGYTKGADDTGGDWTEFKITADPAATVQTPTFTSDISTGLPDYLSAAIAIKPR